MSAPSLPPGAHRGAVVRAESVSVVVGGRALVSEVSIEAGRGEVVGLVGPNGAGKSTLLRTFYRALRPTSGRVLLDDDDLWELPGRQVARRLSAVLQETPSDFELTVHDVTAMGRAPYKRAFQGDGAEDHRIVAEALAALDLTDLAGRRFDRLSGGEKQRVLIARALAQQPAAMVLDEPTNHLDLRHQLDALRLMRRLGVTAVIALHDLNLAAAFCDRIAVLHQGRLVSAGRPAEVITPLLIAEVYGVAAEVTPHPRTGLLNVVVIPEETGPFGGQ
ncbi:ABC transporter ATP-binding protein [Actinoallomurus acaciae]|uniref:ABC transporter ATP-binding protein n=1 Tax=Actinoallomurus acaciae TaxID=502577 RepID=A0ABV5YD17_9ACTN